MVLEKKCMKKLLLIEIALILIVVALNSFLSLPDENGLDINETKVSSISDLMPSHLTAEHAILIDATSGEILFDKNADSKCYPASTTKILTALLALENIAMDEEFAVGAEVNLINPESSIAGIRYGERLTLEQLLYGLLISSGNDAAYTIAVHTARKMPGGEDLNGLDAIRFFANQMNLRANELGAKNSSFTNPDGFHHDQHYSTAHDIAFIALEAMKNPEFKRIVGTKDYLLPEVTVIDRNRHERTEQRLLINTNRLLLRGTDYYPYATGVKTGHTDKAGYCLVSAAEKDGRTVLAVVMKSTEGKVWTDSKMLLDYGLSLHQD